MSKDASTKRNPKSLDASLLSGFAGGIAGCIAKTVVAPLDRVKILFQASNPDFQKYSGSWKGAYSAGQTIYNEFGIRGLFQGHSATLLRVFPYAGVKFMAYDHIHHILMPTRREETNFLRFSSGALSGLASVCVTYPLEVARVRMAFQTTRKSDARRPSFIGALRQIYHESASVPTSKSAAIFVKFPYLKFYRGFTATIVGMVPYAGTSFLCWGYLRATFIPQDRKSATPLADLVIGGVSGLVAQTSSYPFEVIRRRMQVGGITRPDRWLGWHETMLAIYRSKGIPGFFVGLSLGYLKIVPMTAVSLATWQGLKRTFNI